MKTLDNTNANQAKDNVSDLQIWGDGDTWKLICKASSKKEGWMKSTKAMEIPGVGCAVQVTTRQRNQTNVPRFKTDENGDFIVTPICSSSGIREIDPTKEMAQYVISEAVIFIPGVKIEETKDTEDKVISRKLVSIYQ